MVTLSGAAVLVTAAELGGHASRSPSPTLTTTRYPAIAGGRLR